jgi:hydroxymethylpyrimidine pyrophosphatase-like HAD family hydrolase
VAWLYTETDWFVPDPHGAHVARETHPEANKGGVVEFLSKRLHIPTEEIATIGDMPNDVMMFGKSGLSIAMGNASPQVQAQANFVALSNEEDGFAYAMEKFVLPAATSLSAR